MASEPRGSLLTIPTPALSISILGAGAACSSQPLPRTVTKAAMTAADGGHDTMPVDLVMHTSL